MCIAFRCSHCGNDFYLNEEDTELYLNGWFDYIPDTCPDCENDFNPTYDYELYSDADIGL